MVQCDRAPRLPHPEPDDRQPARLTRWFADLPRGRASRCSSINRIRRAPMTIRKAYRGCPRWSGRTVSRSRTPALNRPSPPSRVVQAARPSIHRSATGSKPIRQGGAAIAPHPALQPHRARLVSQIDQASPSRRSGRSRCRVWLRRARRARSWASDRRMLAHPVRLQTACRWRQAILTRPYRSGRMKPLGRR